MLRRWPAILLIALAGSRCGGESDEVARFAVTQRLIDAGGSSGRAASSPAPVYHVLRRNNVYHHTATVPAPTDGVSTIEWRLDARATGRLRFGYAVEGVNGPPPDARIEFAVTVAGPGAATRSLYRRVHRTSELLGAIPLRTIDVSTVERGGVLRFETRPAGGASAGTLRVHWVDPIILTTEPVRPNVLIVMVDTLRADRLNTFGAEHSAMPALDARLAGAAIFSNAYANANWTLPSVASLMTGLFPGRHHAGRRTPLGPSKVQSDYEARPIGGGVELTIAAQRYRFQALHPSMTTIGSRLASAGYYTAAIHENGYLNHPSGVLRGMEYVHEEGSQRADVSTSTAISWLQAHHDERFFLFFHYIDPHQYILRFDPALMSAPPETVSAADRGRVLAAYDDLVTATDTQLARFFAEFDRLGLEENTYVVFLSDHGEQFFTRGVVGAHGGSFDASTLHVPLAIWGPDIDRRRIPDRVSVADVAPTLLEVLQIPHPGADFSGDSLVRLLEGGSFPDREIISEFPLWIDPAWEEVAALRGDFMLIHRPAQPTPDQLFKLPDDLSDVAAANGETARAMRARLVRYLDASRSAFTRLSYADVPVDAETLRSLRALGYIR